MTGTKRGGDQTLFEVVPTLPADPPHHKHHRQRLRERVLQSGADALPDYELLELLLFYSIDRVDVKPLAKALLAEFVSFSAVLAADPARLARFERINDRTIVQFKAIREAASRLGRERLKESPVISSWDQLLEYCRVSLADEPKERVRVLYLDRRNHLIRDELQQPGTVDAAPLYPREVVKRALDLGATALILVHNHPSGDPTPSQSDVEITKALIDASTPLGITVHDHVVVGSAGVVSMRGQRLI